MSSAPAASRRRLSRVRTPAASARTRAPKRARGGANERRPGLYGNGRRKPLPAGGGGAGAGVRPQQSSTSRVPSSSVVSGACPSGTAVFHSLRRGSVTRKRFPTSQSVSPAPVQ